MLKTLFRNVSKFTRRPRRYCTCWCPEDPVDPAVNITYLNNGVRVVTEQNSSPLACISLFVVVGPRYEKPHSNGLTHFIEHMAYKGFKTMPREIFEDTVLRMGAKMSVKTTRDMQIFSILLPAELAPMGVTLLSKILLEIDLNEYEIEKERKNICLEMIEADNNPKTVLFDYLHATAFQGTPLGQPVIGPSNNISSFDKCSMCNFLCEHYSTYRLLLATSGGVDPTCITQQAVETFGCLTPCGTWMPDPGPCRFTGSQIIYRNDAMPHAHVAIAVEAPGYASSDYLGMLVMSCLIGSWHKSQGRPQMQPFSTARIAAALDVCQSYESFYITYKDVGLWGVYIVGNRMKLDEIVSFVQEAWMDMTVSAHSKQVEKAINLAKIKVSKRYDGVVNSCRDLGIQMLYKCTRRPLKMLHDQLHAVNHFTVRSLGDKYIYAKSPAVVGVGPTETLPAYNRIESGMFWLRW